MCNKKKITNIVLNGIEYEHQHANKDLKACICGLSFNDVHMSKCKYHKYEHMVKFFSMSVVKVLYVNWSILLSVKQ